MRQMRGEDGYAIVAAVASIVVFATMALVVMTSARKTIVTGSAEIEQARVSAAADAGIAIGIHALLSPDRTTRWSLDGRTRQIGFAGTDLAIRIEDERGKVPINRLDDESVARMAVIAGLTGAQAAIAVDSFQDWLDDDDEPRPNGAEESWYAPRNMKPRNAALLSIGEITSIRGWSKLSLARIASALTVYSGSNAFDPRFAHPDAIRIMLGENSPEVINRTRELSGQVTAIELGDTVSAVGRPVTIVVAARLPTGAHALRRAIVELTGAPARPYVVLSYE